MAPFDLDETIKYACLSIEDWFAIGGTYEMLYGPAGALMDAAREAHVVRDEMGNPQLSGIDYYGFLAAGGNPDDLHPNQFVQQAEQEVLQDAVV